MVTGVLFLLFPITECIVRLRVVSDSLHKDICELADRIFFVGVTEQSSLFPLKEEFNAKTWIDNHES